VSTKTERRDQSRLAVGDRGVTWSERITPTLRSTRATVTLPFGPPPDPRHVPDDSGPSGVLGNLGSVPDDRAHAGALSAKMCIVGWKVVGSSSDDARTATPWGIDVLVAYSCEPQRRQKYRLTRCPPSDFVSNIPGSLAVRRTNPSAGTTT
jgi:hypothetical protein